MLRCSVLFAAAWLSCTVLAGAQHVHAPDAPPSTSSEWRWRWDGNVVVGWNYQYREFRDFQEIESQNWLMADGERPVGKGLFPRFGDGVAGAADDSGSSALRSCFRRVKRSSAFPSWTTSTRTI